MRARSRGAHGSVHVARARERRRSPCDELRRRARLDRGRTANVDAVIEHSPADVAVFSRAAVDWTRAIGCVRAVRRKQGRLGGVGGRRVARLVGAVAAAARRHRRRPDPWAARRQPTAGRRLARDPARRRCRGRTTSRRAERRRARSRRSSRRRSSSRRCRRGRSAGAVTGTGRRRYSCIEARDPGGLAPRDSWTRFSWSLEG